MECGVAFGGLRGQGEGDPRPGQCGAQGIGAFDGRIGNVGQVAGRHEVEAGSGKHLLAPRRLLVAVDGSHHAVHERGDYHAGDGRHDGQGE